ncbi:STAS domain-containing protein [Streptomyces olivochromogenes]|uniref:Anti-sigma factor antagonist n=1 Tax=Streptomyces olivochromogenes TaxID=1963 RepID=A0A250VPK0_STROL|nr:STAS domain-containing protein [Streptomyces olivochromogenes]GAX56158.1 anti-sigma factor antagonist [Streptomyces olivochromogenes]
MTLPRLNIYRHDRGSRALITLAGEIDPATAPLVRTVLERCLDDGITTIDVDLTTVGRCDSNGLNVFLEMSEHATTAHASLRLHHPSPPTARLLTGTGSTPLLLDHRAPPLPSSLLHDFRSTAPPPSPR